MEHETIVWKNYFKTAVVNVARFVWEFLAKLWIHANKSKLIMIDAIKLQ